jgi:hypothetical protein
MTYRIYLSNSNLFIDYLADSFQMALEMFVEDGGNMEQDLMSIHELPRVKASRSELPEDYHVFCAPSA